MFEITLKASSFRLQMVQTYRLIDFKIVDVLSKLFYRFLLRSSINISFFNKNLKQKRYVAFDLVHICIVSYIENIRKIAIKR